MRHLILVGMVCLVGCGSSRRTPGGTGDPNGDTPDMAKSLSQLTSTVVAPGAPADAATKFGGSNDPSLAPALIYPPDGVLMPPNLNDLEFQWVGAATLYELRLVSKYLDLTIYTPCNPVGQGCGFVPDEPTWTLIGQQSRGDEITLTLRGTSASGGVGMSATRKMSFTDEDLLGGLYYWAAASGAINRYDFGRRGQTAEAFYTPKTSGSICVGCHALSRDGTRIAVGMNQPSPASLRVLDVATRKVDFDSASAVTGLGGSGGSNFEALSPDGKYVLTNTGVDLTLRDAATGTAIGTTPAITNGNMADWSADGAQVVFARGAGTAPCIPGFCISVPAVDNASLFLVPVNGTAFGTPTQLIAGATGTNNYYPAFSPDGSLVVFNRSAINSMDAGDAQVWVTPTSNGSQARSLTTTNLEPGNSWPKFAPFTHHYQGKTIFWTTFSSRRDYALRIKNSTLMQDTKMAQLWMVAVDASGTPLDYPPFWLPFQDPKTGNHIAQWTESVVRQPCNPIDANACPDGETCESGVCVGAPIF